jgi:hypothetical protein
LASWRRAAGSVIRSVDAMDAGTGKPGWLAALLEAAVAEHRPESVPPGHARAYLRQVLRKSGLLYGTPAARGMAGRSPEEVLFRAVLGTYARIGLDVAVLMGAPAGSRREQLLVLFAALTGLLDQAMEIQVELLQMDPIPRRLWARVEGALEQRALSLAGDPAYGLLLHNGAVYVDANVFGRIAIDYFGRGYLAPTPVLRRLDFGHRQKALLVQVLTALACAERPPGFSARRAILRQIEDLRLPPAVERELTAGVRLAFERRSDLAGVLEKVRSRELKRFVLEQVLLASLVDGRQSRAELAFIQELAARLGVSGDEVAAIQLEVAEFYRANRDVVDVFTVSAGAGVMGEEVLETVQDAVEKNYRRLMQEVKETGELSVLLARAARGATLTAEEKARMREQLVDVAKAIPALAIFAAPGGVLLLIALSKLLPFSLLPSSFQEPPPRK